MIPLLSRRTLSLCTLIQLGEVLFHGFGFSGDCSGGETPVPIPNTAVKPPSANGTARESAWESRSLPGSIFQGPPREGLSFFVESPRDAPSLARLSDPDRHRSCPGDRREAAAHSGGSESPSSRHRHRRWRVEGH